MDDTDTDSLSLSPISVTEFVELTNMPAPRRFVFHPQDFGTIWDLVETKNRILWLYQNYRIHQVTYQRIAAKLESVTYDETIDFNMFVENTDGNGAKLLLFWLQDHGVRYDMDPIDHLITVGALP